MQVNIEKTKSAFAKMQSFKWEELRYFLAVAKSRNLSKAAKTLGVNHSTVFRRMATLEKSLGVRLVERMADGYVLTGAGEEMLASLTQIDEEITSLHLRLRGQDHQLTGVIRVTTSDALAQKFLQTYFPGFRKQYPDIHIELITSNSFFNLSKREADVALRPTRNPSEGLVGRKLCIISWALYGSKKYLRRRGRPATPGEMAQYEIISTDESLSHIAAIRWLKSYVPDEAIVLSCSSVTPMFTAATAGLGLCPLPCWMGDVEPSLIQIFPPLRENASELWLLTHRDLRHTARIRVFMDYMGAVISKDRPLFEGTGLEIRAASR
jgi:DNA-binding transcriptional LysR family regulator